MFQVSRRLRARSLGRHANDANSTSTGFFRLGLPRAAVVRHPVTNEPSWDHLTSPSASQKPRPADDIHIQIEAEIETKSTEIRSR